MKYGLVLIIGLAIGWSVSFFTRRDYQPYPEMGVDKAYVDMSIREINSRPGNHDKFLKDFYPNVVIGSKLICVIYSPQPNVLGESKAYCFDKFKNNYVGSF